MRQILLVSSLAVSSVLPISGAGLQFVNVPATVSSTLYAAACDNDSTFIAVGTNSSVLTGKFAGDYIVWSSNGPALSICLLSATFGKNIFLAGGTGGNVVSSTDGLTWGSPTAPFTNFTAYVFGLAFNSRNTSNPNFVAAPALFEIAYSPASLPLAWKGATMNSYSLVESWRAAAPFGQNSFAACGFQGDIRSSTDGGLTWSLSRVPNANFPDLLGIGSDGTNRLVAVGVNGSILFSADGAGSWSAATSPAGATTLNAVAFDGADGLFIVVGNSGVILTSPDGQTWTQRTAGTGQNLHGVTIGRAGNLAGVGILVGDAGKVLLAGTAPPPPTSLGDIIYCEGSELQPMQVISNSPLMTVDWYAAATGGPPVATNCFYFYPPNTNPPPNSVVTNVYYAQARDLRTGCVSSTRTKVTLIALGSLSVSVSPLAQTAEEGSTARFQAQADSLAPGVAYQWFFAGTNLLGASTSAVLDLTDVQAAQAGAYTLVVSKMCLSVTSAPALLSVIPPVPRRTVPALTLMGQTASLISIDSRTTLGASANWENFDTVPLTNAPQWYFDLTAPLAPQRFYRAWQTNVLSRPSVRDVHLIPAITLSGAIGSSVRIDYINQFGPIDAWITLDTVTSSIGQPSRLYRLMSLP